LVLDSGGLLALERNDRSMWRRCKAALLRGEVPVSHGGVIGQVWRGKGPRQALLSRALSFVEVRALDDARGRAAGELLSRVRTRDVVDASLVLLAQSGDQIVTSDPCDIEPLVVASGRDIDIVRT
jgi:hypothetical protein